MEINLVEKWIRIDLHRWKAGILTGLVAGLIAVILGGIVSALGGGQFFFPLKFLASPFMGPEATALTNGFFTLLVGFLFIEVLSAFLGFIFSHFVFTSHLPSLLGMGLAWGAFSWVFLWNLFLPSFKPVLWQNLSAGIGFFLCIAYGLSFALVGTLEKNLKR